MFPLALLALLGGGIYLAMRDKTPPASPLPEGTEKASTLPRLGDPLSLTKGRHYRGRLALPEGGQAPFSADAQDIDVARGLKALGFGDIGIYRGPDLPPNWPSETTVSVTPETRFFEGTWYAPSSSFPRPGQMEDIWTSSVDDNPRLGKNRGAAKLTLA